MANSESSLVQRSLQVLKVWCYNLLYPEGEDTIQVREVSLREVVPGVDENEKRLKDHVDILERSLTAAENDVSYLDDECRRLRIQHNDDRATIAMLVRENTMLREAVLRKVGWEK